MYRDCVAQPEDARPAASNRRRETMDGRRNRTEEGSARIDPIRLYGVSRLGCILCVSRRPQASIVDRRRPQSSRTNAQTRGPKLS
ncbi:hypothetical protein GW17_00033500 [Ensete ventricosum]|nr:hypothetical protein GW17_00033500 [Ensete ventricosum]